MRQARGDTLSNGEPSFDTNVPPPASFRLIGRGFMPCFLGIAATRVWLQCNLFGSYTQSDDGLVTIVSNLVYGLVMLTGALVSLRRQTSRQRQRKTAWISFFLMTMATMLLMTGKELGSVPLMFGASCLAGVGGAYGGAMWVMPFLRLDPRGAVLHTFLALALGSLGGLAIGFLPGQLGYIVSIFMPALALLCNQRAMKVDVPTPAKVDPCYDREPRSTFLYLCGGIAVFGFALGISRGFPAGEPVPLDPALRLVHQLGVVLLSLFVVWWTIGRGKRLSFSLLWRIEIMLVAAGVLILSVFPGQLTSLAIAVINIADTFMMGILWASLHDVARQSLRNPYTIYGLTWATRILSRDLGRVLILVIGTGAYAVTAVIGAIMFALAASMALMFTDGIPRTRPLFADLALPGKQRRTFQRTAATAESLASEGAPFSPSNGSTLVLKASDAGPTSSLGGVSFSTAWLRDDFRLSEREVDVACLIAQGRSKANIAQQLYVTENTVRTHSKNIYAKTGVHSNQELMDLFHTQMPQLENSLVHPVEQK